MEIFAVTDAVKLSSFSSSLLLLHRHESSLQNHLSLLADVSSEASSPSGVLSISAGLSPVDSKAPPIVRSHSHRTVPRKLARKISRIRRRSLAGGDDWEEDEFFGGGDDGPFGGSSGGSNGGKRWNFDGNGGQNWEDESDSESWFLDPAFGFFYEVISWIVLSNCIHFAFKRVVRIVSDGIGDPSREKVPVRFVPVC